MKEEAKEYELTRNKEKVEIGLKKLKENQTHTQVVLGKEFKGQSFISKPDKIIFKVFRRIQMLISLGFRSWEPDATRNQPNKCLVLLQLLQTHANE